MKHNSIELRLDLAEINIIIKALSERPFREVYELIGKIHTQANVQLKQKEWRDFQADSLHALQKEQPV